MPHMPELEGFLEKAHACLESRIESPVIEPLERYRTSSILSGPEVGARLVCVKHKSKSPGVFEADRAISYCALAVLAIGVEDEEETQQ